MPLLLFRGPRFGSRAQAAVLSWAGSGSLASLRTADWLMIDYVLLAMLLRSRGFGMFGVCVEGQEQHSNPSHRRALGLAVVLIQHSRECC